jgi:TetR/AcrR family transcriptional repressor of nem operon
MAKGDVMRVSKEKAEENRQRILTEAARLFRERGLSGVGVDALTQAAGLTHGSLYSQFGSKDSLMAQALTHGHAGNVARAAGNSSIAASVAAYLSPEHRDNPGTGCFMAALGCDMPRQSGEVRHSFTQIVRGSVARLAGLLPKRRKREREDRALALVAAMVGAVVLARAVDDPELSNRILAVTRARLAEEA